MEDVHYVSYQTSFHDSRIDDNEMNMKEIMGKIDRIQEDLQNLVQLNQGSHAQENPGAVIRKWKENPSPGLWGIQAIRNDFLLANVFFVLC